LGLCLKVIGFILRGIGNILQRIWWRKR
jgi:hypothetical protein